jgi:hypothetical protein
MASIPTDGEPEQLQLDFTQSRWPRRPYCSDDPASSGVQIRPLSGARERAHIQPNHPSILWRIPFDVDRQTAAGDWYDRDVPPPSLAIQNPDNGHAHLVYEVEVPVKRDGDTPAMRLAAAVEHGLGLKLGADPDYAANLLKTPGHERWRTTEWAGLYDLTELADWLPDAVNEARWRDKRCKVPDDFALGRNVALFHKLRLWAYKAVRDYWYPGGDGPFREAVETRAGQINAGFRVPLDPQEVRHSARSVARWTWKHMTPAGFRQAQSQRGQRKGREQREMFQEKTCELRGAGWSIRQIAQELNLKRQTVADWLRREGQN